MLKNSRSFRVGSRMISEGRGEWGVDLIKLAYLLYVFGKTTMSKKCRPTSDATERGVWSGPTLFATPPAILYTFIGNKMDLLKRSTVDSRYLEFQGTLWNTSIYPYLDISELQNWGKNKSNKQSHLTNVYILKFEIYRKYCGKEEKLPAISPLFHNILLPVVRFSSWGRDQIFTSR